jgi:hypothetical protein
MMPCSTTPHHKKQTPTQSFTGKKKNSSILETILTTSSRDGDPHGYISSTSGTKRDWTGPSGRHTLKVELFPPHAGFARDKVKEGDHLMLQNVRIKESNAAKMEGNLWQDRQYPDKVLVHHMRDKERPELKELLARKQAYWDSQKKEPEPMAKKKNRNRKKKKPKQNTVDESAGESISASKVGNGRAQQTRFVLRAASFPVLTLLITDDAMRTKDGGPKPIPAVVHNKHGMFSMLNSQFPKL